MTNDVDGSAVTDCSTARRPKYHEFDDDCACGNRNGCNKECERCRLISRLMDAERIMFKLARHVRNTDELPVVKWGIRGIDLLIEARDHNKQLYDSRVEH